jgi:hypothetical protein
VDLPGMSGSVALWLEFSLPMCLPLLPLVVWRVERPRVVLALLALGRFREARAQSGGVVMAVLAAAAVVLCNHALLDLLREGAFVSRMSQLFVALAAAFLALAMSLRARAT